MPEKKRKIQVSPGFELRTFRVWGERDNHYTTKPVNIRNYLYCFIAELKYIDIMGGSYRGRHRSQNCDNDSTTLSVVVWEVWSCASYKMC